MRHGEMPERSIGAVSKTVEPFWVPGVRIPLSPPPENNKRHGHVRVFSFLAKGQKINLFIFCACRQKESCALLLLLFSGEAFPSGEDRAL